MPSIRLSATKNISTFLDSSGFIKFVTSDLNLVDDIKFDVNTFIISGSNFAFTVNQSGAIHNNETLLNKNNIYAGKATIATSYLDGVKIDNTFSYQEGYRYCSYGLGGFESRDAYWTPTNPNLLDGPNIILNFSNDPSTGGLFPTWDQCNWVVDIYSVSGGVNTLNQLRVYDQITQDVAISIRKGLNIITGYNPAGAADTGFNLQCTGGLSICNSNKQYVFVVNPVTISFVNLENVSTNSIPITSSLECKNISISGNFDNNYGAGFISVVRIDDGSNTPGPAATFTYAKSVGGTPVITRLVSSPYPSPVGDEIEMQFSGQKLQIRTTGGVYSFIVYINHTSFEYSLPPNTF